MSLFAKIMVVVNFMLAVVFLASAGTFLGALDNYKSKYEAEKDGRAQQVGDLEAQVSAHAAQIQELNGKNSELDKLRSAAETTTASLEDSSKTLHERNAQLQAALGKLSDTHQTVQDANTRLQGEKTALQDQVNTAQADARGARDNLQTEKGTTARLTQQVSDLMKAGEAQRNANADLNEKLDEATTQLALYFKTVGSLAGVVAMEPAQGRVQAVDNEMDIFVISVGSKEKVKVGYIFTVHRGNQYVSTIVVDEVFPNHASCRTKTGMKKMDVKPGDEVDNQL